MSFNSRSILQSLAFVCCTILVATAFGQPKTLTILHTNDIHAAFVPHEATWIRQSPKPLVGGFRELEFAIDSIRKVKSDVLLLDAGDVMTGNPITDRVYRGVEGGALFEMMNLVGYDAWCIGNHDFDISQKNLIGLTKIANFPTLSANIVNNKNEFPVNNKDYIILERGGLRIGIFGLMSQGLYGLVNQNNLTGIKVLSPVETAQKIIDKIDAETDLIIAVTHQGVEDDSIMAANTHGLDIVVGGHSHTRLTKPRFVNDVIIVQTGSRCENLGELEITVDNDKVVKYNGKLIQLWANNSRPPTRLSALVDSMNTELEKEYSQVIGELKSDWERGRGESNIGNFIADAQHDAAHADVGFMNSSGIRANVSAGPLTKQELFEVLPFRNVLTTFQLTGKELQSVILFTRKRDEAVLISGITAKVKQVSDDEFKLLDVKINGKPLKESKRYICAASDFMVGQSKKYLGLEIEHPIYLQQTVFEALEKAVRKTKNIPTTYEARIQTIK
ncbi:MAG: bifunctional UDP-sugar hydrolase/5'-nucleotidase [bacterium]